MREKKFEKLKEDVKYLDFDEFADVFLHYIKNNKYIWNTNKEEEYVNFLAHQVLYKNTPQYGDYKKLIFRMINNEIVGDIVIRIFKEPTIFEHLFIQNWCLKNNYSYEIIQEDCYILFKLENQAPEEEDYDEKVYKRVCDSYTGTYNVYDFDVKGDVILTVKNGNIISGYISSGDYRGEEFRGGKLENYLKNNIKKQNRKKC